MGLIISRFRRKKTTTEILERLETDLKRIEKDGVYKEQTHKRVIGYVMAYSVGLYMLFAVMYYYMYVGRTQYWLHSLMYASPLLVLPVLVIFLRSVISWYYNWTLNKNRLKLTKMREEKKKILEDVMNTETYKVAKEILDKYGTPEEQSKALKPFTPTLNVPGNTPSTPIQATPGQLRQRQLALQTSTPIPNNMNMVALSNTPMAMYKGPRLRSDQLPRPLLDKNRSALDRVVDYLLKDGPNHRMALICNECSSHNGENEHCSLGGPGTGTTVGRCGDGLTCVSDPSDGHSYCERMTSVCHTAQVSFDARHATGEVGSLEFRPHCDAKGKYAPFDCVPAHTCFCQSEEGERLFGEVMYRGTSTTQNMHCGCSRLHQKIMKSIQPGLPHPVVAPRCTPDGNFYPIQCIGRICYCVDKITGNIVDADRSGHTADLDKHPITEMACYDPVLDKFPHLNEGNPPYNFTAPCLEEQRQRVEMILQSAEDGFNTDFFNSFTECMPDGTYGHVITIRNRTKICADERGRQIADYSAPPNTLEYESMDCKCAYTSHVMGTSTEKPVCCKNGNFRRIQCRRGFCRCVDSDGRQQGREAADVTTLSCFTDDWRTC